MELSKSITPRPASGYPIQKKGIKRCLFGRPDPGHNRAALNAISKMLDERDKSSWNFDFAKGTPCTGGRFIWEKVDSENTEDIPQAYSLPHLEYPTPVPPKFIGLAERSSSPLSRSSSPLTVIQPLGEVTNSPLRDSITIPRPATPTPSTSSTEVPASSSLSQSSSSASSQTSKKRKHQSTQTTIPEFFACKKPRTSSTVASSKS